MACHESTISSHKTTPDAAVTGPGGAPAGTDTLEQPDNEQERVTVGTSHNQALKQYEIYRSGILAGFLRYSVNGKQLWLLYTELTKRKMPLSLADDLIRSVLQDAASQRVEVFPFCPAVRRFMYDHPGYVQLVPRDERPRFSLPEPTEALIFAGKAPVKESLAPFRTVRDNGVRRPQRRRNRSAQTTRLA